MSTSTEKKVKMVDMVAVLVGIGYSTTNAPAMASKFVKKAYKYVGQEGSGRYLPEDLYDKLVKEMEDSKSKYNWRKFAKPVFVATEDMVERVESRAAQLRTAVNDFYKAIPKTASVEAVNLVLMSAVATLKEEFPTVEEATTEEKEGD